LVGIEPRRAEDTDAAGVAHRRDNLTAVTERGDGDVDAEQIAEGRAHAHAIASYLAKPTVCECAAGSVAALTSAGRGEANARCRAGPMSWGCSTHSPWQPSASAMRSKRVNPRSRPGLSR